MEQIRRLLPRQFTDWRGKYLFEEDPDQVWRDCRVLDVSSAGAGLQLPQTDGHELMGEHVILAIHLRGELRNVAPGRNDGIRVGIRFVDLTEDEQQYLESLKELQVAW
jgi:hypothetical protein